MKFRVLIKDPDVYEDAIADAVAEGRKQAATALPFASGAELDALGNIWRDECRDTLKPWVRYGEYVLIEFDTNARTATVLPVSAQR